MSVRRLKMLHRSWHVLWAASRGGDQSVHVYGQVAGEGTRVLGMRAETGGLMGGEMGVGQTTGRHDSRPCGSCRAEGPRALCGFSTHPLV